MSNRTQPKADPRLSLTLAAERYFALHGIANAPLHAIQAAAGQKNASATHYYFGSREGLVNAVIDHRMPPLNKRRVEGLAALKYAGDPTLRQLVQVWIEPLADELRPRNGGNYYLRFLEQLRRDPAPNLAPHINALQAGYFEVFRLILKHLEFISPPLRYSRLGIAADQIISSLARLEEALSKQPKQKAFPSAAVNNLIDYIAGGLGATVSEDTRQLGNLPPEAIDFQLEFLRPQMLGLATLPEPE